MAKKGNSCFEERYWKGFHPIREIRRVKRGIKYAIQRAKYGYCDRDVWSIDHWFLKVVPSMLDDLAETAHGYPDFPGGESQAVAGTGDPEYDQDHMQQWKDTLAKMAFLLREADENTRQKKNPYEEEYDKIRSEFDQKYGMFGDGLKTSEEKAEEKKKGRYRMYFPDDVPEYKEISDKYIQEERELAKYQDDCKNEGIEMFSKWFWSLWD